MPLAVHNELVDEVIDFILGEAIISPLLLDHPLWRPAKG